MFSLLLDHPRFIVVNKPPGIGMHQEGEATGIVTQTRLQLGLTELYPVHRLDKVTSGALLMAKDVEANRLLSTVFRERRVDKFYVALSDRKPSKKQGLIAGDMVKSRRSSWKLLTSRNRPAVTQFLSGSVSQGLRWFLLKPATGKTHQVRVALKSVGAPILGDPLYAAKVSSVQTESGITPVLPDRTYLHAWGLSFPFEGERFQILAQPQQGEHFLLPEFQSVLEQLSPPWQQPWPPLPGSLMRAIQLEPADESALADEF